MGYTVTIKPVSKLLADKMVKFLTNYKCTFNFDDWGDSFPQIGNKPSHFGYCKKRGHIGFNFGPPMTREFAYTLIAWMNIKICNNDHVYYYDGEKSPIENRDEYGVIILEQLDPRNRCFYFPQSVYDDIKAEMKKIDAEWIKINS